MIFLYNIFWFVGVFLSVPLIIPLVLLSDKRRKTFPFRVGIKPLPIEISTRQNQYLETKTIWIHALSVGEVLSSVSLVKALRENFRHHKVFISVSTQTGFNIAQDQLNNEADVIFFFPYDFFFSVRHVTRKLNPDLVIIVETDVWPNFLSTMNRAKIPVILVNARISDKSFRNYKRFLYFSRKLFSGFTKICTQSIQDAKNFERLGVPPKRMIVTGNMKFDQDRHFISGDEKDQLRRWLHIDTRAKVFIAGSTHNGEESILRNAFVRMKKRYPDLVLIVAPRDPKRAQHVKRLFTAVGIETMLFAEIIRAGPDKRFDVAIIDTIGLLGKVYGLADIAFVGGSLTSYGGHNPLEPAAFAIPIVFGFDMSDFKEISQMLVASGGAAEVQDEENLFRTVVEILGNDKHAQDMGRRAFSVFSNNQGAVDRTLQAIKSEIRLS